MNEIMEHIVAKLEEIEAVLKNQDEKIVELAQRLEYFKRKLEQSLEERYGNGG